MRWGAGEHAYTAPSIHRLDLRTAHTLPLSIFNVARARRRVGHRTLPPDSFKAGATYTTTSRTSNLARVSSIRGVASWS